MSHKVFILHTRALSDSRLLLELFEEKLGRLSAVHRVGRRSLGKPQLFHLYHTELKGKNELRSAHVLETIDSLNLPPGIASFSGLYLNELLYRLLPKEFAAQDLFLAYRRAIVSLSKIETYTAGDSKLDKLATEYVLRRFELSLFSELGFGFDIESLSLLVEEDFQSKHYRYDPVSGWQAQQQFHKKAYDSNATAESSNLDIREQFSESYYALHNFNDLQLLRSFLQDPSFSKFYDIHKPLKRLTRLLVDNLLNGKKLRSRELFY